MRAIRWGGGGLTLLVLVTAVWGFGIEPGQLAVREVPLALPGWRGGPLRLAVLSDLHVGAPHISLAKVDSIVAATNAARPDAVALLGDFVIQGVLGGTAVSPEAIAQHLAGLRAPLGVFGVLGNHDWWLDGVRVGAALAAQQVVVLENQAVRVLRPAGSFWFVGLADLFTRHVDSEAALSQVTDDAPVVVLSHHPDVFASMPPRVALTLAGHTHGGQIRLPLLGPPVVPSHFWARYAAGHVEENGRHLFVSSGIGTSILPVRLGVTPEVVILTIGETLPPQN